MEDMKEIVKLAVDAYHGNVEKYSVAQSQEALREAMIELNGGSTKLDYKRIRDGKCAGLFTLIEEIIDRVTVEGLQGDEFWNSQVEFRNIALGDQNKFLVEDNTMFTVSKIAEGTQGIRRQRLSGVSEISIPTEMHAIRIYEELNRILTGAVDFNKFINKASEAFQRELLNEIYALWSGVTAANLGGVAYFPAAGSYNEDVLLDVIAHVEAASGGKQATIIGSKKAVRTLAPSITSTDANNEMYHAGYYGTFYGNPVVAVPQRHAIGSTNFILRDDLLTIVASDEKPLKVIYEGDTTVLMGDPMKNADFTQDYYVATRYGMGLLMAGGNSGMGRYEFT